MFALAQAVRQLAERQRLVTTTLAIRNGRSSRPTRGRQQPEGVGAAGAELKALREGDMAVRLTDTVATLEGHGRRQEAPRGTAYQPRVDCTSR